MIPAERPFIEALRQVPPAHDHQRAAQRLDDLLKVAEKQSPETAAAVGTILNDGMARPFLSGVFGNSAYLARSAIREAGFLTEIFAAPAARTLDALLAAMESHVLSEEPEAALMAALRQAKRRAALLIALADIAGIWRDQEVTRAITCFADQAVSVAVRRLLADAGRKGDLELPDPADPARGSGLALIAMGKQGAYELNYSSDIDFVIFYDQAVTPYCGRKTAQQCFIRLTQSLVKILQAVTADGYVLRCDLRLRPDPGVTPVVISMAAAESYYESMGQNWERAAMIKARPFAGDLKAGEAFLERLLPFVWRRNLDFAAIEDVHSIKRQIHQHRGHSAIAVAGHNIKLGRGGIRDIEFFVQTQQLIAGGRDPSLRRRGTIEAMAALREAGWIDAAVADELTAVYHRHRKLEHRLQMINDEQTHSIGRGQAELDHLARFLGHRQTINFETELLADLERVQHHYRALFEDAESLAEGGNLVFTGSDDDPDTLASLAAMGYRNPVDVSTLVKSWHHGRYRAIKSTRSRELLTKLVPQLLSAFAGTADANAALARFDRFLDGLPAGIQLFSLLTANPGLLDLLAEIIGDAPRLANYLSRNATVLDAVLAQDFWQPLPPAEEMVQGLAAGLRLAPDLQERLDVARRFVKERKFQLGVQMLHGAADADRNGAGLADLADAAIGALLPHVIDDFAQRERRGQVPGGTMVVLAMGKYGSREMTETSDLDLVFIYDYDDGVGQSDGERAMNPAHYYSRLAQRLLNALSAPTGEGVMWEVDMRLRPSGNKGPAATRFAGFVDYHDKTAWTWEHMALTRARVIAGDEDLARKVEDSIAEVLTRPRDPVAIAADAQAMRRRIEKEHGSAYPWELKQVPGGLIDLEFISQYLQLVHAYSHPGILDVHNRTAFGKLAAAGILAPAAVAALIDASMLISNLSAVMRVAVTGDFDAEAAPLGVRRALSRAAGSDDFEALEIRLQETQQTVRALYRKLLAGAAVPE